MVKDQEDLKALISWMKRERVSRFRINDMEVEFAPNAHVADTLNSYLETPLAPQELSDEVSPKQDDETLFYSA